MKRKLFLGIDLDPHLKKMLGKTTKKWDDLNLPIKWYKDESLHLTLVYLGWIDESMIFDLSEKINQVCVEFPSFDIQFEKIKLAYKDNKKENHPKDAKMVWLEGQASEELKNLQKKLEEVLGVHLVDKKSFRPHITLGRMRAKKWAELSEFPNLDKDFAVTMEVMNVTLFQSSSNDDFPDYSPVGVFDLGD